MKQRLIGAACLLPALVLVYLGGYFLFYGLLIVSLIGLRELYNGFKAAGIQPAYKLGYAFIGLLYVLFILADMSPEKMMPYMAVWAVAAVMASMIYGFNVEKRNIGDMPATLFGIMYLGLLMIHMVFIDNCAEPLLIWSVLLIAFGTDIFAYFAGSALGKHKLCPKLSPKKSVEGAIGGILGAVILNGVFMYFVIPELFVPGFILSVVGSVVSQLGDLSASAFKRQMGIKDYGKLIPGHGGILDRFDSVLFTAPAVFWFMTLWMDFAAA